MGEAVSRLNKVSMRGGGGGGGHPGFRGVDIEAQKKINAAAPKIPHLGGRGVPLFRPYTWSLVFTAILVVVGAGIAVIPPLIVQRIFDDALFPTDGSPPDMPLLWRLVAVMVLLFLVSAGLGVLQTWFTSTIGNRV